MNSQDNQRTKQELAIAASVEGVVKTMLSSRASKRAIETFVSQAKFVGKADKFEVSMSSQDDKIKVTIVINHSDGELLGMLFKTLEVMSDQTLQLDDEKHNPTVVIRQGIRFVFYV